MEEINLIEVGIYLLNFIITFVMLYLLLYKPVSKHLASRKERIAQTLDEAEQKRKESEGILQKAHAELEDTEEKARQITHEAIENAALDAEQIVDNAEEEAAEIIARAREQVKAEREAAIERALTELVSLAGELSSRILSREVKIDDNRQIVDSFFNERSELAEARDATQAKEGIQGSRQEETL